MYNFFNTTTEIGQNVLSPAKWNYAKSGLLQNLLRVQDYYKNRPFAVKSQHILARLLNSFPISYNLSLERFYSLVDTYGLRISVGYKMTSSIFNGKIFNDIFYGEGIDEILVATDESFNPYRVTDDWINVSAVRVLAHPNSDLRLLLPNGKNFGTETGLAVISINIPMLAVQYKAFLEYQNKRLIEENMSTHTTAQFIHMYVLPNMLKSHLDVALFNRAYNLVVGAPMGDTTKKHAFYLTDYTGVVDDVYEEIVDYFKRVEKPYNIMLKSFFTITEESFETLMLLPDNAPTRQVMWSNLLARLRAMEFLLKLSKSHGNTSSRSENNNLNRILQYHDSNKLIETLLPENLLRDVRLQLKEIKEMLG